MTDEVLTAEEVRSIAAAVIAGHDGEWVDEEEITRAVEFCERVRINAAMLRLVLAGRVDMRWNVELGDWQLRTSDGAAP